MRLRYENTMDDLLAFQEHYMANSPTVKRSYAAIQWAGAFALLCILFLILTLLKGKRAPLDNLVIASIGAIAYGLYIRVVMRKSVKQQTLKLYSESDTKGNLCEHELEIVDDGLVERTAFNETKTAWAAVGKIASSPEHTFIYTGAMMAHVIPHNRLIEGDYRAFMEELGRRYKPDQTLQTANRA